MEFNVFLSENVGEDPLQTLKKSTCNQKFFHLEKKSAKRA